MKPLAAALAFFILDAANAATPADYAAVIPITTRGDSAAWLVELNQDSYLWSQDENLRDIAIFSADGKAVPVAAWNRIAPDELTESRASVPLLSLPVTLTPSKVGNVRFVSGDGRGRTVEFQATEVLPTRKGAGGREWLIDASKLAFGVDTITLSWDQPKTGVMARFNVSGSSDLQNWRFTGKETAIVLIDQDGAHIERRDIDLAFGRWAYLRLIRLDDGPELVGLRAEVSSRDWKSGQPTPIRWIRAEPRDLLADQASSDTRHLYALPAALPINRLRVNLVSDNALAELQAMTAQRLADGKTRWSPRTRFVAYRLRQGDHIIDNREADLSAGPRVRELRIDSATPLVRTPELEVGYRPQQLVFLAEGKGPYVLAVGSAHERYPDYPVEAAIEKLRPTNYAKWQPPTAEMGSAIIGTGEVAMSPLKLDTVSNWKRWLLWGVLILAAAVVGGIALSLLRTSSQGGAKDRQQPPEE
jgi:hypothetical protein